MCEYENCKNAKKTNEDFCGRHIKKGDKLKFPEKYCKKKNCVRLKFTDNRVILKVGNYLIINNTLILILSIIGQKLILYMHLVMC